MISAVTSSPQWLNRYLSGRREEVWHELRQQGSAIRKEPDLALEVQQVCDEMARRARQNVDLLVARLTSDGYRFHSNDFDQTPETPHVAPTDAADEHAGWLQEYFVEVPMTVLSWVRFVGDVWLVGTHPHWSESASADPLVIEFEGSRLADRSSMREYFEEEWEDWKESAEDDDDADPYVLSVAPDRLHKENVSGGPPYGIVLPDGGVDAVFVGETTIPFVSYLNQVFSNGGFPWATGSDSEERIKRALANDLLPL